MTTVLDNVADAIFNEEFFDGYPRWGTRDHRFGGKGFEVFRCDDNGAAGEFSDLWSGYESQDKADVALSEKLAIAKARAALQAIREPDLKMLLAMDAESYPDSGSYTRWQAAIDTILEEKPE